MDKENLIYFGDAVKALGDGKIGGYLVRYSTENDPDLSGEFFTKATELGVEEGGILPVFYDHGLDSTIGARKIGRATAKFDETGLWLEAQLQMRDKYERMVYELAEQGKQGWSSGAAGHLVEYEPSGKALRIKTWIIAEASLTPKPAEPRNSAVTIKSLFSEINKETTMTDKIEQVEAPVLDIESIVKGAVADAIKAFEAAQPKTIAGVADIQVTDEADRAVKSNPFTAQDFFKSVYKAAVEPHSIDSRLLPMKALGMNEAIPSQGGFLVPQDIAAGIFENMWGVGSILSLMNAITVSGNGLTINAVDETSRVTGSRMGGVQGYWLAEAGTKLASKPKFRQIDLKLKKVAALCYATDELLEDASALQSWIANSVPNELRFLVEDAIINGDGVGKPLGILSSGALVSAARTDANEIDSLDISRMWSRRYVGANDYVWLGNASIAPQLYNMTLGNYPVYLPPNGFSGSMYGTLMGRPYIETEYNPALGSVGDLLLASPSHYAFITKGGVQAASSIHVQFVTDETAFRFVYRCDGEPYWEDPVTPFKGSNTVSPFVALLATT